MTDLSRAANGTALITGGSSGVGAGYADWLARHGYDLILVARDRDRLTAVADGARRHGTRVEIIAADLANRADVAMVGDRLRQDEAVSFFLNNAGVTLSGPFLGRGTVEIEALIDLNVTAFTVLAVAAADAFTARGRGAIVNVSSSSVTAPDRSNPAYAGSKSYVLSFTQGLARELRDTGVQLQVLLPGVTRTEIFQRAGSSIDRYPDHLIMEVSDMVDACMKGLALGELVTIPSLPDYADWQALEDARRKLARNVSHQVAAERYR